MDKVNLGQAFSEECLGAGSTNMQRKGRMTLMSAILTNTITIFLVAMLMVSNICNTFLCSGHLRGVRPCMYFSATFTSYIKLTQFLQCHAAQSNAPTLHSDCLAIDSRLTNCLSCLRFLTGFNGFSWHVPCWESTCNRIDPFFHIQ
jgi:hypothetical protein